MHNTTIAYIVSTHICVIYERHTYVTTKTLVLLKNMSTSVLKNQNSYSTPICHYQKTWVKEKKEMILNSKINPQWTEVEDWMVVTKVVKVEAQTQIF